MYKDKKKNIYIYIYKNKKETKPTRKSIKKV